MAIGTGDGRIRISSIASGQQIACWTAHAGPVRGLQFAHGDDRLLSWGPDVTSVNRKDYFHGSYFPADASSRDGGKRNCVEIWYIASMIKALELWRKQFSGDDGDAELQSPEEQDDDDFPEVSVVFTGSSLLEILNARADLSRRAVMYSMQGLSFREFLNLEHGFQFSPFNLNEIIENHGKIATEIVGKIQPIKYFSTYLKTGYYPFFRDNPNTYDQRLEEIVNFILEIELPTLRQVDPSYIIKLKQLLMVISSSVPFKPNVTKLAERIGINRNTLITYFHYLEESGLTQQLFKDAKGITRLQKPDKIYLDNTNLLYTIAPQNVQIGHVRETFFANQLAYKHLVEYTDVGDFRIDQTLTFEIGGKHKTKEQVKDLQNAFIAADDIEIGFQEKIPLWLFGFLY